MLFACLLPYLLALSPNLCNVHAMTCALWLAFLINFAAFPFTISLLPFSAKEIFHVAEGGLGILVTSYAGGAFVGSVLMATTGGSRSPARFMFACAMIWFVLLAVFGTVTDIRIGVGLLAVIGVVQSFTMLSMSSLIIGTAAAELRGRVLGVRMLAVYGLALGLPLNREGHGGVTTTCCSLVHIRSRRKRRQ